MLKIIVAMAGTFLFASGACAGTLAAEGDLEADKPGAPINRYIYGQFSEHLGRGIYEGIWVGEDSDIPNVRGIRSDVVAALKAVHVPIVRWPGGCFADAYNWRDGIGPRSQRPVRSNKNWGSTREPNSFGTHEFMDFVEQIGADPYVSINVGSSTPRDMSEWIEYMTSWDDNSLANERRKNGRDKPWRIPAVGIGNESWGCGGNMTPEVYASEYRRYSAFFYGSGSPSPRVASGANAFDTNWTSVVMRNVGVANLEAISLHYYTVPTGDWNRMGAAVGFPKEEWVSTFAQTLRMDDAISQHSAVMDAIDPQKKVALYIDEWGAWTEAEPGTNPRELYQLNSLRDGVLAAANFNIFHQHTDRVRLTAIAQTVNVLQAMILTKGDKIALTPTYYAYKMYVPFQDATPLPLRIKTATVTLGGNTIPAINASAAKGKDGKLYIGIANMAPDDQVDFKINLGSFRAKSVSGQFMTGKNIDSTNAIGLPPAVVPLAYKGANLKDGILTLNLPSKSVVVVSLQ